MKNVLKKKDSLKNVTKILSLIYKLFTGMLSIYNKLCIHYNTVNRSFTAWKVSKHRVISDPKTRKYRNNSVFGHFSGSRCWCGTRDQ